MKPYFVQCSQEKASDGTVNLPVNMNLVSSFKRAYDQPVLRFYLPEKGDYVDWTYDTAEERDVDYMRLLNEFCL